MDFAAFSESLAQAAPPPGLSRALEALWWDAKGDWSRAHGRVDALETKEAMAVHAYLHRKQGDQSNADYWYRRAGEQYRHTSLAEEWNALVAGLVG